jgi:3-dehydroquinate synthase
MAGGIARPGSSRIHRSCGSMATVIQRIAAQYDFPVVFTRDVFAPGNPVLKDTLARREPDKRHRALVVIDAGVADAHPQLPAAIARYFAAHPAALELVADALRVPGGEAAKNDLRHVLELVELTSRYGIDRHSYLIAIGGGAVLDMASFAAAIAHRSVRVVRVPTTVLSQDDSGVGVKNGINLFGKKNYIGTFMPPFAVLNDSAFLATLAHRDRIAGMAEAVKVALIRDPEFYGFLEANAERLARAEPEPLEHLIRRSAEIHMQHIANSGDPFEQGSARPLDFGHWAAHKLESLTAHRLRHGEAVAIGIALDTVYSAQRGHLPPETAERIVKLLETIGFTLWAEELDSRDVQGRHPVLQGLREFREHLGGILHITLLRGIGDGFEVHEMDEALVLASIDWLRTRHAARARIDALNATGAPGRSAAAAGR